MDEEYEDLSEYTGDPVHDMNVDYDHFINTGEPSEWCDGSNLNDFINAEDGDY